MNIYFLVALVILLGFILGEFLRKVGLSGVLAYIFVGVLIGPVLNFSLPKEFGEIITGITLAFVAYMVGLSFSFNFLKKMGKKVMIILTTEVLITSLAVGIFIYLLTKNLPLSIILASLSPATAPAGTLAVLREFKARGLLTDICVGVVGLDDGAGIVIYSLGVVWVKMLLKGEINIFNSLLSPLWEIFGALLLGGIIGYSLSYLTKKKNLSSDHIFVLSIGISIFSWGLAKMIEVSPILTCMVLGATMINFNLHLAKRSTELIDKIMTPIFILFFAAVGMEINFSQFATLWALVMMYCLGRTVGKITGCGLGGILSKSESKIKKYLGVALLNQAGVAVGLAFLAAQELSGFEIGELIITLIATTTAIFQIFSPLGTQYAVKKAGEARV